MDFEFPEDTLMLRDMLRRFIQKEARPLEMDYFNTGSLKPEQRARLRRSIEQLGLWGYLAPEELGGAALDMVTSCLIEEELGGTFLPLEMGNVPPSLYACQGDQVGKFLEPALEGSRRTIIAAREPGVAGVNPETWITTAARQGEKFVLEGSKVLSILPEPDDFFIVYAHDNSVSSPEGKNSHQTAFILEQDNPGIVVQTESSKSDNGRMHTEIILKLKECQVGSDRVLGAQGEALKLASDEAPRAHDLDGSSLRRNGRKIDRDGKRARQRLDFARRSAGSSSCHPKDVSRNAGRNRECPLVGVPCSLANRYEG